MADTEIEELKNLYKSVGGAEVRERILMII